MWLKRNKIKRTELTNFLRDNKHKQNGVKIFEKCAKILAFVALFQITFEKFLNRFHNNLKQLACDREEEISVDGAGRMIGSQE